jgi:hypothetical protein
MQNKNQVNHSINSAINFSILIYGKKIQAIINTGQINTGIRTC